MGATPVTALQYLAWPREALPFEMATEVIEAGMDIMSAAGCTVVGGHSIDGPEPTYGFAVTGIASLDDVVTNSGAVPGDDLVLTKPLGMGIITTAIKRGGCPPDLEIRAIEVMTSLNDLAGRSLKEFGATAATDVTGYGLLGHLVELCRASGAGATVLLDSVPVLEGVTELLAAGMWAGGSQRNLESIRPDLVTELDIDSVKPLIDAQTSGGLLVALAPEQVPGFLGSVPGSARIGSVTSDKAIRVA
jgi:selenide,water dikinase